MIKYILHGGNTRTQSDLNKIFFQRILELINFKGNILIIPFASKQEDWNVMFKTDVAKFQLYNDISSIQFECAELELEKLKLQIINSDVIYLRGGNTLQLLNYMKLVDGLVDLINGKIIVGTSAGSLIWCKYFYSQDTDDIHEGLGILNKKFIVHFDENQYNNFNSLVEYKGDYEVIGIKEQEFKEFNLF